MRFAYLCGIIVFSSWLLPSSVWAQFINPRNIQSTAHGAVPSASGASTRTYDRYNLDKYISGKEVTPQDSIRNILMSNDSAQLFKDRLMVTPDDLERLGASPELIEQLRALNGMQDSLDVVKEQRQLSLDEAFRKKYGLPPPKDSLNLNDLEQLIEFQKRQLIEKALALPPTTVYGQAFFRNSTLEINQLSPELDHRPPDNYTLSTGDEITVTIWGMIDYNQSFTINKDGYIKPPLVGQINLKGMAYSQARDLIKQRFAKVYDIKKSQIAISLSFVRLISVNLVGELLYPGTYRFPAFTSAYNALVAISGPNNLGSVRNIYIQREGKTVATLDLYQYLLNPNSQQDFFLEQNDYIVVPTQGNIVSIVGQVKRADNYELKPGEQLSDLLHFSGGLHADAYRAALHLKRYQDNREVLIDIDLDKLLEQKADFALQNGDTITVSKVAVGLTNHVQVLGAVRIPGYYQIKPNDRLSDALQKAQGTTERADLNRAYLERLRPDDKAKQIIAFNIAEILANPASPNNVLLQNLDTIRVLSTLSVYDGTTIQVIGAVRAEGEYDFTPGMNLSDALYQAGGIKVEAANNRIEVSRVISFADPQTQQNTQDRIVVKRIDVTDDLSIDAAARQFPLQPYDHVFVRKSRWFEQQQLVKIYGEVEYPGEYALQRKDETLTQLIERAGGLNGFAFETGAKLYRFDDTLGYVLMDVNKALQKEPLPRKKRQKHDALVRQLSYNYILMPGDSVFVPKIRNVVTLAGAMRHFEVDTAAHQISAPYEANRNAREYVIKYGAGYGRYAKRIRTYVKKPNGEVEQTRRFLFFKHYPEVTNGSVVFVDETNRRKKQLADEAYQKEYYSMYPREPRERKSFGENFDSIASRVTSLITLIILIRQLGR